MYAPNYLPRTITDQQYAQTKNVLSDGRVPLTDVEILVAGVERFKKTGEGTMAGVYRHGQILPHRLRSAAGFDPHIPSIPTDSEFMVMLRGLKIFSVYRNEYFTLAEIMHSYPVRDHIQDYYNPSYFDQRGIMQHYFGIFESLCGIEIALILWNVLGFDYYGEVPEYNRNRWQNAISDRRTSEINFRPPTISTKGKRIITAFSPPYAKPEQFDLYVPSWFEPLETS